MFGTRNVIVLILFVCFGFISSEIELTFSNEENDEQSFIVKTESKVQNSNNKMSQNETLSVNTTIPGDSDGAITMLKIMKGDVVLLEKTTADIGRDGYDIDIESDLLDTGENTLDLLLLSANGTVVQQERITVFSPPQPDGEESTSQTPTNEHEDPEKDVSITDAAKTYLRLQLSSIKSIVQDVLNNDEQRARVVKATYGTVGIATCGAILYSLRRAPRVPPRALEAPEAAPEPPKIKFRDEDKSTKNYLSKFPRYPLTASTASAMDFSSPKMLSAKLASPTPTSLVENFQNLVLGRANQPRSYTLLAQGGMAFLGVKVTKALLSKISRRHYVDEETSRGGFFRIGKSKPRSARGRWKLGSFFSQRQ